MTAADHGSDETHIWTAEKVAEIKALLDVCAHIVGPTDVLVLTTAMPVPQYQMDMLPEALKGRVVVIDKSTVDMKVVRKKTCVCPHARPSETIPAGVRCCELARCCCNSKKPG